MSKTIVTLLVLSLFCTIGCAQQSPAETLKPATTRQQESPRLELSRQNTLVLFDVGPTTLDPALVQDTTSAAYVKEIFSGLVMLNRKLEVVPDIAKGWDVSEDGKIYTFHLREDVKFHNGEEVTAQDFKYSLERACDPATGSKTAANYLGDIAGVWEKLSGKADKIKGVKVKDDYTLQITLEERGESFLAKLTYPVAFVVDQSNVESGKDWGRNPNGSGPFKLIRWKKDRRIILERNEHYYGGMPRIKHVVYQLWGGSPMIMYEKGEIDITQVSSANVKRVLDPANPLHDELKKVNKFSLWYVGFNTTKPPFNSVKVRQAFCHAIDKDKIIDIVLKNTVRRAETIVPPGMPYYNNKELEGLDFNPDRAKELIRQSKYGSISNLPPITFTTAGRGNISPINEALKYMWERNLGVEIKMWHIQPERYAYVLNEEKGELFDLGWVADYPSPQNFLDMLFHSNSQDNIGEYSNTKVDALLEAAEEEGDREARMEMYREAEEIIVNEAACLPLYFGREYFLVKPYVEGFAPAPMPLPWLKWVDCK